MLLWRILSEIPSDFWYESKFRLFFFFFSEIAVSRSFSQFANTSGAWPANMFLDYDSGCCCEKYWAKSRAISGMNQNFVNFFLNFNEIAVFRSFSRFANTGGAWPFNRFLDYDSGCCCEEYWAKSLAISGMNQNFVKMFLNFSEIAVFRLFSRFANTSGAWLYNMFLDYDSERCCKEYWAKCRMFSAFNQNFVKTFFIFRRNNRFPLSFAISEY